MSAIGPDDTVEYIGPGDGPGALVPLALYVVDTVGQGYFPCEHCGCRGLTVRGVPLLPFQMGWCVCAFRPVRDGQARIARPAKVCEPA